MKGASPVGVALRDFHSHRPPRNCWRARGFARVLSRVAAASAARSSVARNSVIIVSDASAGSDARSRTQGRRIPSVIAVELKDYYRIIDCRPRRVSPRSRPPIASRRSRCIPTAIPRRARRLPRVAEAYEVLSEPDRRSDYDDKPAPQPDRQSVRGGTRNVERLYQGALR